MSRLSRLVAERRTLCQTCPIRAMAVKWRRDSWTVFQPACTAKGGFDDLFMAHSLQDWDILEPDLNNSNVSNGTWSLAVETVDKVENMSATANMTEWNGSLLNMGSGESGNDAMNDTDNESSMHGNGADLGAGNMSEQYDNESVNDSENDPANVSGNSSMVLPASFHSKGKEHLQIGKDCCEQWISSFGVNIQWRNSDSQQFVLNVGYPIAHLFWNINSLVCFTSTKINPD